MTRPSCSLTAVVLLAAVGGCGVFNDAFLTLLDPTGESSSLPNAPGHVIISFINNAEVDERLLSYLESPDGGNLVLTDAETRDLRPRVRFRVQVTYRSSGATQTPPTTTFEFVDGSSKLVDQDFDTASAPDLTANDLDNVVISCGSGVERIEVLPGAQVEVFIPAEIVEFQQRQLTTPAGDVDIEFVETQRISPQFRGMQPDDVDGDNNLVLRRNMDIRQVPVPIVRPVCGTVAAFVMSGVLEVPFLFDFPSYDIGDTATVASIGGQYAFVVQSVE